MAENGGVAAGVNHLSKERSSKLLPHLPHKNLMNSAGTETVRNSMCDQSTYAAFEPNDSASQAVT